MNHFSQLPGIIGGIGPESSNYFTSLLITYRLKDVKSDQDHIPFILFNNPQIPDRTNFLVNGTNSPLPELIKTAQALKTAGATFLVIPCNTVHALIHHIEQAVQLPVLNMIQITATHIASQMQHISKIGLLATTGTVTTNIYPKVFNHILPNTEIMIPNEKSQENVQKAIYSIKSSSANDYNRQLLATEADYLVTKGAEVIILGCTEIPLSLSINNYTKVPLIDPMELLAKETIKLTLAK